MELPGGFTKDVLGYADQWSVLPGERINFKLGSYAPGVARASMCELICGDDRPHGPGLKEREIAVLDDALQIPHQPLLPGSCLQIKQMPTVNRGRLAFWFYPTFFADSPQCLWSAPGVSLWSSERGVEVRTAQDVWPLNTTLQLRRWVLLSLEINLDQEGALSLQHQPYGPGEAQRTDVLPLPAGLSLQSGDWLFACQQPGHHHFDGRLAAPQAWQEDTLIGCWSFEEKMSSQLVVDTSDQAHHGQLLQTPVRAARGPSWSGQFFQAEQAPEQYNAIHFHADDLTDAGWEDVIAWQIPENLPSGQYALRVDYTNESGTTSCDHVPFFVRASRPAHPVVYLAPTASYLAYANQRVLFGDGIFGDPRLRHANDAFLYAHKEVGYSMYEHHRDGSGVHFSSRHRPVLNMKPQTGTWAFNADTHLTDWLHETGQGFDVLTDEDLHRDGVAALAGYQVIVTGSHPEYYSTEMLDAVEQFVKDGGRLMYMGGNGFYWRVAFSPDDSGIMEVRRAEDGTRAWISPTGEYYHQFSGEYGGLWRRLGRPPNVLTGVGFAAQGFDGGTYFRVGPGALDERVAFAMEGVEDEVLGDFGNQGGGAAGEEIDRWDAKLGSPAHAVILASSENHRPGMLRVKEEYHMMEPPDPKDPNVRADVVFFETPGGGAVFSTGSISWAGSLAHNNYHNNIARLTGNVLKRFSDPAAFSPPTQQEDE